MSCGAGRFPRARHSLGVVGNGNAGASRPAWGSEMTKSFFVDILTSRMGGRLYAGVTSDLLGRTHVHREDLIDGFSRRYGVHKLVRLEHHENAQSAITREKQIEKWNRDWKIRLIEERHPRWEDLHPRLTL